MLEQSPRNRTCNRESASILISRRRFAWSLRKAIPKLVNQSNNRHLQLQPRTPHLQSTHFRDVSMLPHLHCTSPPPSLPPLLPRQGLTLPVCHSRSGSLAARGSRWLASLWSLLRRSSRDLSSAVQLRSPRVASRSAAGERTPPAALFSTPLT